jgi:hypothetical protein
LTSEEQVADIRVKIHLHVRFASAIWGIFVLYYLALALENAGAFEIGILCVFSAQTQRQILRVNKPLEEIPKNFSVSKDCMKLNNNFGEKISSWFPVL